MLARQCVLLSVVLEQHKGSPPAKVEGLLAQQLLASDGMLSKSDAQGLAARAMRERNNATAHASKTPRLLQFYSQSKDIDDLFIELPAWRKVLSNFCDHSLVADGAIYSSVKH